MKRGFVRLREPGRDRPFVAWVENEAVYLLPDVDLLELVCSRRLDDEGFLGELRTALSDQQRYPYSYGALLDGRPGGQAPHLILPFDPPEVWGVGVSYHRTAELHEEDIAETGARGIYNYVFQSARPEIFFKGLARHCVGHGAEFGIRGDSEGTMLEAELACVFQADGRIVGYTIANDITAWDIEKECPLFLSYAKIFDGSCVLGPGLVPASLVPDPLDLAVSCRLRRGGKVIYSGDGSTSQMKRTLSELGQHLTAFNTVPDGTVLCTGTALAIPHDLVLQPGDEVDVSIERLGEIRNTARSLPIPMQAKA